MRKSITSLLVLFALATLCCQAAPDTDPPHISIDAEEYNFGQVDEGSRLQHIFKVSNSGGGELILNAPYASCGCTIAKLAKRKLLAGEATDLSISIDTAMKQDEVTKHVTIYSNDKAKPIIMMSLSMTVRNPHNGMSEAAQAKIFTDPHCASCHVNKGKGLQGRELYNADCAMCHGPKAEGAVGPALFGPYRDEEFAKHILDVAAHGSKTHRSMPGFLKDSGGPLSQTDLDSIVDYLRKISKARGL